MFVFISQYLLNWEKTDAKIRKCNINLPCRSMSFSASREAIMWKQCFIPYTVTLTTKNLATAKNYATGSASWNFSRTSSAFFVVRKATVSGQSSGACSNNWNQHMTVEMREEFFTIAGWSTGNGYKSFLGNIFGVTKRWLWYGRHLHNRARHSTFPNTL